MILVDVNQPHLQPLLLGERENVTSAMVFSATGGDVSDVFVNGKRLVKDGVLTTVDVSSIIGKVQEVAKSITQRH